MNQKARPKTEVTKNPPAQGSGPQGKIRRFVSAGMRWVVLVVLFLLASCLLASCLLGLSGQAQTPGADPYEPDESAIERRFSARHRYTSAGNYQVRFRLMQKDDTVGAVSGSVIVR